MVGQPGMKFWPYSNTLRFVSIESVVNKFECKFVAEGNPRYGYSILLTMMCGPPCIHFRQSYEECMDTVKPSIFPPIISNRYWGMMTVVGIVDLMMLPAVVQKGLTVEKLLRCRNTKNLELPTCWLIIHMGQGRLSSHEYFCIV